MANRHQNFHIIISPPPDVRELMLSSQKEEQLKTILSKHCKVFAYAYEHGSQGSTLTHIDIYCEFKNKQAKDDIKKKLNKLLKDVEFDEEQYDLFICIKSIKTEDPRTMLGYTFKESPLRFYYFGITQVEIDNFTQLYQKKCEVAEAKTLFKVIKSVGSTLRLLAIEMTDETFVDSTQGFSDSELLDKLYFNLIKRGYVFNLRQAEKELVAHSFFSQFSKNNTFAHAQHLSAQYSCYNMLEV